MNLNKMLERLVGDEIVNKRAKSYLGYEQKMESRDCDNYGVYAAKLIDFVSDWLNDKSNQQPQPFDNELQQDQFWKDLIRRYLVLNSRQLSTSSALSDQDADTIKTDPVDQQSFDDLFFFVLDDYSKSTGTDNSNGESGGYQSTNVIVRRNDADTSLEVHVAHILPSAEIRWKDTLLLNLICHLQYQIVVSKCTKNLNIQRSERQQKLKISSTTLIPIEQSVKNLYASPYKMTVMDAGRQHNKSSSLSSHKLTYPICYFTLSDYDSASYSEDSDGSASGHIILKDSLHERDLEYLTVELILKIPRLNSGGGDKSTDMTLFQGAVSYYALREAFQTKRRQSVQFDPLQNLKNVFSSINRQFKGQQQSSDIQNQDDVHQDQQFILMRGPNGKGFAQVALSEIVYEDQQVGSSQIQSIQKGLKCDMVYISLPQSSIISDILNAVI
ncbi:hypothetical protein MIR68_007411 [Amoeboaphelidium protococcarum]|nr:hypothetical protein MIR68_007411 [Amoeboaphelidium protococcarum]